MADATVPNNVNPETWKQIQLHERVALGWRASVEEKEAAMRKLATAYKGAGRLLARQALMRLTKQDDARVSGHALCMLNKHFGCNANGTKIYNQGATGPVPVGNGGKQVRCPIYTCGR